MEGSGRKPKDEDDLRSLGLHVHFGICDREEGKNDMIGSRKDVVMKE